MKTLNVRLGPKETAAVKKLRRAGDNVSDIVREALVERAEAQSISALSDKDVLRELDALHNKYPGPTADYIRKGVDITDRKQMSAYIRSSINRKKGKSR